MKKLAFHILAASALLASVPAQAISIDFKALAEPSGIGESIWNTLMFDINGNHTTVAANAVLSITATNGGASYAYLDSGNAGLGGCGAPVAGAPVNTATNSSTNLCNPSNDDNVSHHNGTPETLHFAFASNVVINSIWLNNNHDGDRSLLNDYVSIEGSSTQITSAQNSGGDHMLDLSGLVLSPDNIFDIGFIYDMTTGTCLNGGASLDNCEFYVSKIDFTVVPVPAAVWLFGSGLLGLVGVARRRTA